MDGVTTVSGCKFASPFPPPAPAAPGPKERHTRNRGWGDIHLSLHFSPVWLSFQREFTMPSVWAALRHNKKTAMATKSAKWPKCHEGTAGLGWGRVKLILKEKKTTALENFSFSQTSVHEELLK